jgi:hypothetical protein
MTYAATTKVPVSQSISEIQALVKKNGGTKITTMDDDDTYIVAFLMLDRSIKFTVTFDGGTSEQLRRSRFRALGLVMKAKFESIEAGVETFEQAFLANVVTATGATVYDRVKDSIAIEYDSNTVRPLMIGGPQ